jgi:crotonobetainyl-CoA:carnitine CoA-transferase CaiB-like acyl-CoA transferase
VVLLEPIAPFASGFGLESFDFCEFCHVKIVSVSSLSPQALVSFRVSSSPPAPLAGIRIADFTRVLTGPFATQTLGDFGADIIKIEPPAGDDTRAWGPPYAHGSSEATYFQSANRNKRSITIDLKTESGLEAARKIIASSDVLIENFRPGTLEKLGLAPVDLMARDSRLIVCSITGFGSSGPLKSWAGYDVIAQGMSGFMAYTGDPAGDPTKAGVAVADIFAGALATQAILAALFEREKTGRGRKLEVNLLEAMIALGTYQVQRYLGANEDAERLGNEHRSIVPYGTYKTRDGFLNIAGGNDALYQKLVLALRADDLLESRFATNPLRVEHRADLIPKLEAHLARFTTDQAVELLQAAGVPCGPVWSVSQAMNSAFVQARGVTLILEHPSLGSVKLLTPPFEFDGQRLKVRYAPPTLGEHSQGILEEVSSQQKRVYLAIKYHANNSNRASIETISSAFESRGCKVVNVARDLEQWGKIQFVPSELMRQSFDLIRSSDVLLLEFSEKGIGLGIEAGFGHAIGKRIVVVAKTGSEISNTLAGISSEIHFYDAETDLERIASELFQTGSTMAK